MDMMKKTIEASVKIEGECICCYDIINATINRWYIILCDLCLKECNPREACKNKLTLKPSSKDKNRDD